MKKTKNTGVESYQSQVQRKFGGGDIERFGGGGSFQQMKEDQEAFPEHKRQIAKTYKAKRQNILSGKSVRTPAPKRKRISAKKGGGG
tara:strand:+ start:419 stop:679 length:261 start_codon:yes stop_codon:yes gene_type:complete